MVSEQIAGANRARLLKRRNLLQFNATLVLIVTIVQQSTASASCLTPF
jgi:hypothetical protein